MEKRNNQTKSRAIRMRKRGVSYRKISLDLGVARSTLNYWLKDIKLTKKQEAQLYLKWQEGLRKARVNASKSHRKAKQNRLKVSREQAVKFVNKLSIDDSILEIFLAGLYLGDGFKIEGRLGLGNANPEIVLLFIILIRKLYVLDEKRLRGAIYCRADQNHDVLLNYWSELLDIPINQFHKTQSDSRTVNRKTREGYMGVCAVIYADSVKQRRILAIGKEMIKCVNKKKMGP